MILGLFVAGTADGRAASAAVRVERVPDSGLQPQVVQEAAGAVHLLYYKGAANAGDLFYARKSKPEGEFSAPIRVNHAAGSAMAIGTIRGGQLAVGRNGRVHVVWNGHAVKGKDWMSAPLLYTRLAEDGKSFEVERDVLGDFRGLDGGSSVGADTNGRVIVVWHAPIPGLALAETNRAVFVARSKDEGKTFETPTRLSAALTGACGCCGLKAFAAPDGTDYVVYRMVGEKGRRDIALVGAAAGMPARLMFRDPWETPTCPMSSATLTGSGAGILAGWETEGRIHFTRTGLPMTGRPARLAPADVVKGKHPVVLEQAGFTLVAWSEGTGWQRGGGIAWQAFDGNNDATEVSGRRNGLPAWSFPAAYAAGAGQFVVMY